MPPIRFAAFTLVILYGAYVGFVVFRVAGASHWLASLLFFCWAVSPLAALVRVRYKSAGTADGIGNLVRFCALIVLAAFGVVVYQGAFFGSRPDAQSSLLLLFIPLYQWVALAVVLALLAMVSRYAHRRHGT